MYRPVETPWSYYVTQAAVQGITQFAEGEEIKVSHVTGSPFARLRGADTRDFSNRVELWHSHGCYYDDQGKIRKSDELWEPKAEAAVRSVPVTESIRYQHGPYYRVPDYWLQFIESVKRDNPNMRLPLNIHHINEYLVPYNGRIIEEGYVSWTLIFESQRDFAFFLLRFA